MVNALGLSLGEREWEWEWGGRWKERVREMHEAKLFI